ncbi:hypothetical protein PENNAL_c0037G06177, partial [Penicillium nalgiovense]
MVGQPTVITIHPGPFHLDIHNHQHPLWPWPLSIMVIILYDCRQQAIHSHHRCIMAFAIVYYGLRLS